MTIDSQAILNGYEWANLPNIDNISQYLISIGYIGLVGTICQYYPNTQPRFMFNWAIVAKNLVCMFRVYFGD